MTGWRRGPEQSGADNAIAVGGSVRVHPDTEHEQHGVVVDDYGGSAGYDVRVGQHHVVDAARRWAVQLDDGGLMFVDTSDLASG